MQDKPKTKISYIEIQVKLPRIGGVFEVSIIFPGISIYEVFPKGTLGFAGFGDVTASKYIALPAKLLSLETV